MISMCSASIHIHSARDRHLYIICMCCTVAIQRPECRTWYSRRTRVGVLLQQHVAPPIYSLFHHMEVCTNFSSRIQLIISIHHSKLVHHLHSIVPFFLCMQVLQPIEPMAQPWWSIAFLAIIDRLASVVMAVQPVPCYTRKATVSSSIHTIIHACHHTRHH